MSTIAVVGAGPAGLMAAERLAAAGHAVTIHDAMPSPARKFLLAGRGGLNLTHSEPIDAFLGRYREASPRLAPIIGRFPPDALRAWSAALGEETFVCSSGRVFPTSFKASPLLRAWLRRLSGMGVVLRSGSRWTGFSGERGLRFATAEGEVARRGRRRRPRPRRRELAAARLERAWTEFFAAEGIAVSPLRPSNCGFTIGWSAM